MSFLQSPEWAEIQRRDGREVRELVVANERFFYFRHDLRLGFFYWYMPKPAPKNAAAFLGAAHNLQSSGALFFRIEPEMGLRIMNHELRIMKAENLQPKEAIIMDLLKSDEELLALMHPKTRYNINLAKRHGVTIEKRVGSDAIDDFYRLLSETSKRDTFHLHPKLHYANLLASNSHTFSNELFFAVYKGELAAAAIVNFYEDTAAYLHGASRYELRNIMAPYLLHWQIMQEARERGCRLYDLWGIDEKKWPGVTRFKRGFGGLVKTYPPAFDAVFRPFWYFCYRKSRSIV